MSPHKPLRGVAASVVLYTKNSGSLLLIQRKWEPDKGKWAFPGGMMEAGQETIETTAVRELREETGAKIETKELHLLQVLSEPARDPRGHVVDICYLVIRDEQPATLPESHETVVRWASLEEAADLPFALGHGNVYKRVAETIRAEQSKSPSA